MHCIQLSRRYSTQIPTLGGIQLKVQKRSLWNYEHNVLQIHISKNKHSLKEQKPQGYELVCFLVHVKLDPHKILSDGKKIHHRQSKGKLWVPLPTSSCNFASSQPLVRLNHYKGQDDPKAAGVETADGQDL